MSSGETPIALKRTADQAGLVEILHSQTKRSKNDIFEETSNDELAAVSAAKSPSPEHHHLSTIPEEEEKPSSPALPPLPVYKTPRENSASPDYGLTSLSPLSVINTGRVINSDQFAVFERDRRIAEQPRQTAEENVFDSIARFKSLNGGKLNLTIFELLEKEVHESIYCNISVSPPVQDTAIITTPATTYTSTSTGSQTEQQNAPTLSISSTIINADITADDSNTVTIPRPSYSNGSTQTNTPALGISSVINNAYIETDDNNNITTIKPSYSNGNTQTTAPSTAAVIEPDWASIYSKELKIIRMQKPFVTGKGVIMVKTKLRPVSKLAKPAALSRVYQNRHASVPNSRRPSGNNAIVAPARKASAPDPMPSTANIISLDDSDDEAPKQSTRTGGASGPTTKAADIQILTDVRLASGSLFRVPSDLTKLPTAPSCISSSLVKPYSPTALAAPVSLENRSVAVDLIDDDGADETPPIDKEDSYRVGGGSSSTYIGGAGFYSNDDSENALGGNRRNNTNDYGQGLDEQVADGFAGHSYLPQSLRDAPSFYGFTGREDERLIESMLRFQDRDFNAGFIPGPLTGTRLQFQQFLNDVGIKHTRNPEEKIRDHLKDVWGPIITLDEEAAIEQNWCSDSAQYDIMKGYPLVEDVEFIVHKNLARPDGDCYWRTISFCLYGTDEHWNIVKAEHLAFVHYVLGHTGHARHKLYVDDLNSKFVRTASSTADSRVMNKFMANMWQVLHMAHAWTPAFVQQVTADLYNICVIMFTREGQLDDCTITETAVRGSYNARHIFIQFVGGNHFQPMCPNNYRPSEFQYPRLTVDKTAKYSNAPKATSSKTGLSHPWRNDFTKEVPAPVPRLHGCDTEGLSRWLGSR